MLRVKFLAVSLASLSLSALALEVPSMTCKIERPCAHSEPSRLGFCLGQTFAVQASSQGQGGRATIYRVEVESPDVQVVYKEIPLSAQIENGAPVISGTTDSEDNWLSLNAERGSRYAGRYLGHLAIEEDFGFDVECSLYGD